MDDKNMNLLMMGISLILANVVETDIEETIWSVVTLIFIGCYMVYLYKEARGK